MNETATNDLDAASTLSTIPVRQIRATPSDCKVCSDSARYSYYGAIVCQSCKVFFKRNVIPQQDQSLRCHFDNECDINVNNRRTCPACRLKKCFSSGMCIEMIRSSQTTIKKGNEEINLTTDSVPSTTSVPRQNQNQPEQIPVLNLLRSDQSTLTIDQWNLLSNLVHCFNEYSGHSFAEGYIRDQVALLPRLRFKCSSVRDFFTTMKCKVQLGIEKNRDLLSLSSHDRIVLLRTTAKYTSSIGGMFTLRQSHLFDDPSFYESSEMIFRPTAATFARRIIDQLDPDDTLIKLMLAIVATSTIKCSIYTKSDTTNLVNISAILAIQNTYVEVAWRYMVYKYGQGHAVIRFSNLVRCLLFVNDAIVEAHESKQFTEMINTVIAQVEQNFRL